MHQLTRVRAYARLIVTIVTDDSVRGRDRTDAIDALVQRMIDTTPADHHCAMTPDTWVYCEGCASA